MIVRYLISIDTETEEQAEELVEDLIVEEARDYGFPYSLIIEFHSKTEVQA